MRWDTSPECRALIDRDQAAMLRAQKERALHSEWQEQDIRANGYWHERNLIMLERCVAYAKHDQVSAYFTLLHRFHVEEQSRLRDKLAIMERYALERLPSPHMPREQALWRELKEIFKSKGIIFETQVKEVPTSID